MIGLPLCLSGAYAAADFPRLTLLAWPAALLVSWRVLLQRLPRWGVAAIGTGLAAFSVVFSASFIDRVAEFQGQKKTIRSALARVDLDEPDWMQQPGEPLRRMRKTLGRLRQQRNREEGLHDTTDAGNDRTEAHTEGSASR